MKNKYTLLLLFAAFCCMGVRCKEERTELEMLPPVTSYGANTFGCLINGRAWPVYEKQHPIIDAQYSNGRLFLSCDIYNGSSGWVLGDIIGGVTLSTDKVHAPGHYRIVCNKNFDFCSAYYESELYLSISSKNAGVSYDLQVLRLDSVNHIFSGQFSFSLLDRKGQKRISIEHGRFDIFYQ